jgi:MYND finger
MPEPAPIVATLMGQLNAATMDGPHTAGETDEIISGLLESLPIMFQQPFPKWDEAVIAPMGGDVENVARAALKDLRFHVSHPKRDIFRIRRITQSLNLVSHLSNHKPILDAFMAQGSWRTLIRALDTLAPLPSHSQSPEYATRCISVCCNCIAQHFQANDGLDGIIEAYSCGILPVLLRCADLLVSENAQYISLLCKHLPRFIIYPSVLRVVARSLYDFVMPEPSIAPSATSKRAQEIYTQFVASITKLVAINEVGLGHGKEACSNASGWFVVSFFLKAPHLIGDLQCRRYDLRSTLRLCTGCKAAYYCSVSCQKADWNDTHRARCKESRNSKYRNVYLHKLAILTGCVRKASVTQSRQRTSLSYIH